MNRTDKTSTRYQIRIVNLYVLDTLIIPLLKLVSLRTKKKDEFLIWADLVHQLRHSEHTQNWPSNMLRFIESLRELKYVGLPTDQALDFISTCNELQENVIRIKPPK